MKLVKDYVATAKMLLSDTVVYNRNARVKRTLKRLMDHVIKEDPAARNMIKQYYKIYLTPLNSTKYPKLRITNMIILPFMVNKRLSVYNGKVYSHVNVSEESIGRYLGEYVETRTKGKKSIKKEDPRKGKSGK